MPLQMKHMLWCLVLFFGCAPTAKLSTSSGRPEVTIIGINNSAILNDIATWSKRKGQEIGERTDSSISTFTEGIIMVDTWETRNQPTKDTYQVPNVNFYSIKRSGDTATIYLKQYQTTKRASTGVYTGDGQTVTKELTKQADLERMQSDLNEIAQFIRIRKL